MHGHGEAETRVRQVLGELCHRYQAAWISSFTRGCSRIPRASSRCWAPAGSSASRPPRALSIELDIQDWFGIFTAAAGREVP
jgi:predicted oxidoreductase